AAIETCYPTSSSGLPPLRAGSGGVRARPASSSVTVLSTSTSSPDAMLGRSSTEGRSPVASRSLSVSWSSSGRSLTESEVSLGPICGSARDTPSPPRAIWSSRRWLISLTPSTTQPGLVHRFSKLCSRCAVLALPHEHRSTHNGPPASPATFPLAHQCGICRRASGLHQLGCHYFPDGARGRRIAGRTGVLDVGARHRHGCHLHRFIALLSQSHTYRLVHAGRSSSGHRAGRSDNEPGRRGVHGIFAAHHSGGGQRCVPAHHEPGAPSSGCRHAGRHLAALRDGRLRFHAEPAVARGRHVRYLAGRTRRVAAIYRATCPDGRHRLRLADGPASA